MQPFDPETATAAYLASIPAKELASAIAYTRGSHWILLWSTLASILSCLIIFRSGLLARLRNRFKGPNLAVFLCVVAFFGLDWLIRAPLFAYDWWRERQYDLTRQDLAGWIIESAISATINALCIGLLALAVYALIRRTARWWAWSGLVTVSAIMMLIVVSPVVIEPIFNTYRAAPAGETRDAITVLARKANVPANKIVVYDGSRQSERYTARVSGFLGTARIAISDTMLREGADIAEIRAVVGHEMGHYSRGHVLITAIALSVVAVGILFSVNRLFPPLLRRLDSRAQISGLSDPAAAPVLMILFVVLGLLVKPLTNTLTRLQEMDADRFSLEYAQEPDGMARALIKSVAYRAPSPYLVEEIVFYDHPSVERRLRNAMFWKAADQEMQSVDNSR